MIVVGGEALVDLVPVTGAGEAAAAEPALAPLTPRLGGGPCNVAVALGRLGVPTRFLSRISTDPFGAALIRRLEASTVDIGLVQRGGEPTTLAVVGLGPDGSARYTFHVEGTADRFVADPGPLPADTRAVSLGTLSLLLEPGASVYEQVLHREARAGRFVALDPNIRPDLIADPAAYRARFASWLGDVALLKLSVDDAAWLADEGGRPAEAAVLAAARRWQEAGPVAVVLTSGAEGITVLFGGGRSVRVPAEAIDVADTIGAGDTVQAALLAWLYRHDALAVSTARDLGDAEWSAAARFAVAASGITCTRAGAEPPFAAEVAALA